MDPSTLNNEHDDETCLGGMWLNPKGALSDRLPDLKLSKEGIESTRGPTSYAAPEGALQPWVSFDTEVHELFTCPALRNAFERTRSAPIGPNAVAISRSNPNNECVESLTTGSDDFMKERFQARVFGNAVLPSFGTMTSSHFGTTNEIADTGTRIPRSMSTGTHKALQHFGSHCAIWSPSRILPDADKDENVKMVGLYLAANEYEMSEEASGLHFKNTPSAEVFGMLVEAMNIMNVSYGYLTTYMQTVFFKLEEQDGVSTLHYSNVIKHSDVAKEADNGTMETISLRLAMFFIMCKAVHG